MYIYEEDQEAMDKLVGATVTSLAVADDGEFDMKLETDLGALHLPTQGECCSESWWADAVGVRQLLGGTVSKVEWIDLPEEPDNPRSRQEVDCVYGLRVSTNLGVCDLIFRNSSNGYYGGECQPTWTWYGGHIRESYTYTPITDDWSA